MSPNSMSREQLAREPDFDLAGYHYWRECPSCGHAGGGYLHCAHDGHQNPCHGCGQPMPTLGGDCKCEFVLTHADVASLVLHDRLATARRVQEACAARVQWFADETAKMPPTGSYYYDVCTMQRSKDAEGLVDAIRALDLAVILEQP